MRVGIILAEHSRIGRYLLDHHRSETQLLKKKQCGKAGWHNAKGRLTIVSRLADIHIIGRGSRARFGVMDCMCNRGRAPKASTSTTTEAGLYQVTECAAKEQAR